MIKQRAWPVKAMYLLIAAALAIGLIVTAAPAGKVSAQDEVYAEWDRVPTPTTDGFVLAPDSIIIDYALASDGEVAYAVVLQYEPVDDGFDLEPIDNGLDGVGTLQANGGPYEPHYLLLKSDDHAATWTDISDDEWAANNYTLVQVATDGADPDFVAVALDDGIPEDSIYVYFSTDGGDTFEDEPGKVEDSNVYLNRVSELAVSYEVDGKRDIAIGGEAWDDVAGSSIAGLFRCTVTGDSATAWEDATAYEGWDDEGDFDSEFVTDIVFSPNWEKDKTVLITTYDDADDSITTPIDDGDVYLQSGSWGTSPGWNIKSTLGIEAVLVKDEVDIPTSFFSWYPGIIAGITLPQDYNSKDTDSRLLWVWVNYLDDDNAACEIMRVDDDSADPVGPMGQVEDGEVWLTNVSYQGTIAEGEALAGALGSGAAYAGYLVPADCCEGVQVYRNDGIANMDICCIRWEDACKPPTGKIAMSVSYVGDDKAYAVALWGELPYDEGAWSMTFDDGDTWNQLSLIDTWIDYFSDVAVSPDCNKTMLASVNLEFDPQAPCGFCGCDSVWLHAENLPEAEEYSGKWLRTWCGEFEGDWEAGLLRLAPEETNGDTVYLVDYGTGNVYWNGLETLACWDPIASTLVDEIVDLAAQDADTAYALDYSGDVAMFDDDEWHEAVASEVTNGYSIAVWGDWILVGGEDGDVSYSDDGGETFTALEDVASRGLVTVAFDSYFDHNDTIYAAVAAEGDDASGVYRFVVGESEAWTDLRAEPLESQVGVSDGNEIDEYIDVDFTGLVVDNADGNPHTTAETGGVIYASYYGLYDGHWFTGVARRLYPTEEAICKECGEWDYLYEGLTVDEEGFYVCPDAVKICGCLTSDTNSKLFAIDGKHEGYDMEEGKDGTVWTFEDCYAKKAPEITSPADGYVVPADPCSCFNVPFNVAWDRLCGACSYDIQVAMDEDFEQLVLDEVHFVPGAGDAPTFNIPGGELTCEFTYYYRVRASDAETGQIIRSWWSDSRSVTIAPSQAAGEIDLVSPEPGATEVAVEGVGFSWDLLAQADEFDWWIDDNSDFSSPVEQVTGLTSTAYEATETMDYDTTYYWQVIAYNEGAAISSSAVGTFRTMEEPAEPTPAEEPATPFWVWVIIAIGAVLVIVVIVLIFRTRRV
jgi:hypothetical protein